MGARKVRSPKYDHFLWNLLFFYIRQKQKKTAWMTNVSSGAVAVTGDLWNLFGDIFVSIVR